MVSLEGFRSVNNNTMEAQLMIRPFIQFGTMTVQQAENLVPNQSWVTSDAQAEPKTPVVVSANTNGKIFLPVHGNSGDSYENFATKYSLAEAPPKAVKLTPAKA